MSGSKTGARLVPLSPAAALPRIEGDSWVILGMKPGKHLADLNHDWDRVRERSDLKDVRIHDLRHTFASRALALGESLPMIGKLLGHSQIRTTERYGPSGAGFGQGIGGPSRRQHRRGLPTSHAPVGFRRRQANSCQRASSKFRPASAKIVPSVRMSEFVHNQSSLAALRPRGE